MRYVIIPILAASFLLGFSLPAAAGPVSVPAGTPVSVHVVQTLSSGNATVGQPFTFVASAPVLVGNRIVIQKGANGTGRVAAVSKAHGKSAGKLELQLTSIHAVDGSTIALTGTQQSLHGKSQKGKASTATIATTVLLGPIGLFAHNFVKASDVTVTPEKNLQAWVNATKSVNVR